MNRHKAVTLFTLIAGLTAIFCLGTALSADAAAGDAMVSNGYRTRVSTISNSTDTGSSTNYRCIASAGQAAIDTGASASYFGDAGFIYQLHGGYAGPFWYVSADTGSDTVVGNGSCTHPFKSISRALLYARAGETVWVYPGTYSETITIDTDNLFLVGSDSLTTIIDPPGDSSVTTLFGIYASGRQGIDIRYLQITGCYTGIYFDNIDLATLNDVAFSYCGNTGLRLLSGSETNTVSSCSFTATGIGIDINAAHFNQISGNMAGNNSGAALSLTNADSNTVTNSVFSSSGNGIGLVTSDNNLFTGNTLTSNASCGVTANNSHSNTFLSNSVSGNGDRGFSMINGGSNNIYRHNRATLNTNYGFLFNNSNSNVADQNLCDSNAGWQFYFTGCSSDTFTRNNIFTTLGNPDSGVWHDGAGTLDGSRNWWGTADSTTLNSKLIIPNGGSIDWQPFRLGVADTADGADTIAPAAPDTVAISSPDSTSLLVTWAATTTNEDVGSGCGDLAGYRLYRAVSGPDTGNWGDTIAEFAAGTHTYTDNNLNLGQAYWYRVTAYDNHSPWLNESYYSDSIILGRPEYIPEFPAPADTVTYYETTIIAVMGADTTVTCDQSNADTVTIHVPNTTGTETWTTRIDFPDTGNLVRFRQVPAPVIIGSDTSRIRGYYHGAAAAVEIICYDSSLTEIPDNYWLTASESPTISFYYANTALNPNRLGIFWLNPADSVWYDVRHPDSGATTDNYVRTSETISIKVNHFSHWFPGEVSADTVTAIIGDTVADTTVAVTSANVTILCIGVLADTMLGDTITGFNLINSGTLEDTGVDSMALWHSSDGDSNWSATDTAVAYLTFDAAEQRWTGNCSYFVNFGVYGLPDTFIVTIDVANTATVGCTFQATLPQFNGINTIDEETGPQDTVTNPGSILVGPPAYSGPFWHVSQDTGSNILGNGSGTYPFQTIFRALEACAAGDTIQAYAGTFSESVVITKDTVTLMGFGDSTTIDPAINQHGISASGKHWLVIRDIRVQNITGAGVSGVALDNCDSAYLENVSVYDGNNRGIDIGNGAVNARIYNCRADSFLAEGIRIDGQDGRIDSCTVQRASTAIYLAQDSAGVTNNLIFNNTGSGIHFNGSDSSIAHGNSIIGNGGTGFYNDGYCNDVYNNTVSGNNTNIEVYRYDNTVRGCTFSTPVGANLIGGNTSDSCGIYDNYFDGGSSALFLGGNTNNYILGNIVLNTIDTGIFIAAGSGNVIANNRIDSGFGEGIAIGSATNNFIISNFVGCSSDSSIHLSGAASGNRIRKNNFTNGAENASVNAADLQYNYWGLVDTAQLAGSLLNSGAGSLDWQPFRLGQCDTAAGADTIAPNAPDSITVTALSGGLMACTWTASVSNEEAASALADLDGYRVYRSLLPDTTVWQFLAQLPADAYSFTDSGLTQDTPYYYRISAIDNHANYPNESFFSDSIAFDTNIANIDITITAADTDNANTQPLDNSIYFLHDTLWFSALTQGVADTVEIGNSTGDSWITYNAGDTQFALNLASGTNVITIYASNSSSASTWTSYTVFGDTEAPVLAITFPADGSGTNTGFIRLQGTVSGNYDTPEYLIVSVNFADTRIIANNTWDTGVGLVAGTTLITVGCSDAAGHYVQDTIAVISDTTLPALAILYPSGNDTTAEYTTLSGTVTDNFDTPDYLNYSINGVDTRVISNNTWDTALGLISGTNVIIVSCSDAQGNYSQTALTVLADTIVPAILFNYPPDLHDTQAEWLPVSSTITDSYSSADTVVFSTNYSGTAYYNVTASSFDTGIGLAAGTTIITVGCSDALGNYTQASISVTCDTLSPSVAINLPVNNHDTGIDYITLSGTVADAFDTPTYLAVGFNGADTVIIGNATWDTSVSLRAGTNVLTVGCSDPAGNYAMTSISVVSDTIAPTLTLTYVPDGTDTLAGWVPVAGTLTDSYSVAETFIFSVNYSGTSYGNIIASSWDSGAILAADTNTVTIGCSDALGNYIQTSITITCDTTAPTLEIQFPADNHSTTAQHLTISGTVADNFDTPLSLTVNINATDTVVIASNTWDTGLALRQGTNVITVGCSDPAGNYGENSITVISDTIAPTLTIAYPLDNTDTASGWVPVSGTLTDSFSVAETFVFSVNYSGTSYYDVIASNWDSGAELAQGTNVITVGCSDALGNYIQSSITVMADTVAPTIIISYPPDGHDTLVGWLPVIGTITDSYSVAETFIFSVNYSGTSYGNVITSNWDTGAELAADTNIITIGCSDALGNYTQASITVTSDTTAPTVEILFPADGHDTGIDYITVSGTAADNFDTPTFLVISINGSDTKAISNATWDTGVGLVAGTNVITVGCSDAIGNYSQTAITITSDTVAPVVTITYPPAGHDTMTEWIPLLGTVTDVVDTPTYLIMDINGADSRIINNNNWDTGLGLVSGTSVITVGCSDAMGNYSQTSATVTCDTIPPRLAILVPALDQDTNISYITLSGTVTDNYDTPDYLVFAINGTDTAVVNNATWDTAVSLRAGTNVITVSCSDGNGNFVQQSVTVTSDTVAPVVTITYPLDGSGTYGEYSQVSGTVTDVVDTPTYLILSVNFTDTRTISNSAWDTGLGLISGTNVITVGCSDAQANYSQATITITSDTFAPTLEIQFPADLSSTSVDYITVSGTVADNFDTPVYLALGFNGNDTIIVGNATWDTAVSLRAGTNVITVGCSDPQQNYAMRSITVISDTTAPTLTIVYVPDGTDTQAGWVPLNVTVTDSLSASETVIYSLNYSGTTYHDVVSSAWDSGVGLAADTNIVTVGCSDALGNYIQTSITITSDTTKPTLGIQFPADNHSTSAEHITLSGTVADNFDTPLSLTYNINGSDTLIIANNTWDTGAALRQGTNVITVGCSDPAGNYNERNITVISDTLAPTLAINYPANSTDTAIGWVPVSGTLTDSFSAAETFAFSINYTDTSYADVASGGWDSGAELAQGTNVITVGCSDALGNYIQSSITVVADTIAPTLTIAYPAAGTDTNTGWLPALGTIADSYNVAAAYLLSINYADTSYAAVTASAWDSGAALAAGTNIITVGCSDALGNYTQSSITVTSDTSYPTVGIVFPAAGDTNAPYTTVSGTVADNFDTPDYLVMGINGTDTRTIANNNWDTGISLAAGTNVITIGCSDAIGNYSQSTVTVVADTIAPYLSIAYPGTGFDTNVSWLPVSGILSDSFTAIANYVFSVNYVDTTYTAVTGGMFDSGADLARDTNVITVGCSDAAGNYIQTGITLVADTTAPTIAITWPRDSTSTDAAWTPLLGILSDSLDVDTPAYFALGTNFAGTATISNDTYTADWDTGIALQFGANIITVSCSDPLGNYAMHTTTIIRAGAPILAIAYPPDGHDTSAAKVPLSGTASDSVDADTPTYFVVSVNYGDTRQFSNADTMAAAWDTSTVYLVAETNVITVGCSDGSGNYTQASVIVNWDTQAPYIYFNGVGDSRATDQAVTVRPEIIDLSDTAGIAVYLVYRHTNYPSTGTNWETRTMVYDGGAYYTADIPDTMIGPDSDISAGRPSYYIAARDAFWHWRYYGADSYAYVDIADVVNAPDSFTVSEAIATTVHIWDGNDTSLQSIGSQTFNSNTIHLVIFSNSDSLAVIVNSDSYTNFDSITAGAWHNNTAGTITIASIGLYEGTNTIQVIAADSLGIQPTYNQSWTIRCDTIAPVYGDATVGDSTVLSSVSANMTFTAQDSNSVSAVGYWGDITSNTATYTGAAMPVTLSAGEGWKTVWHQYMDAAGNLSATFGDSFYVDLTSGTVTMGSITAVTSANYTCTGTVSDNYVDTPAYVYISMTSDTGTTISDSAIFVVDAWPAATFHTSLTLLKGLNTITVSFSDTAGHVTTDAITIGYADAVVTSSDTTTVTTMSDTLGGSIVVTNSDSSTTSIVTVVNTTGTETAAFAISWALDGYNAMIERFSDTDLAVLQTTMTPGEVSTGNWSYSDSLIFRITTTDSNGANIAEATDAYDSIILTWTYNVPADAEDNLHVYYAPDINTAFQKASDVAGLVPAGGAEVQDKVAHTISLPVTHLSVWGIFAGGAPVTANLDNIVIFPNPFKPYDNDARTGTPYDGNPNSATGIHFMNLMSSTEIKIYTINGELVDEVTLVAGQGMAVWDGRTKDGEDVASGIYLVVFKAGDQQVTRKLSLIR